MKQLPIINLNERHFDLENGQYRVEIYGQPIYYHKKGKIKTVNAFKLSSIAGDITNDSDEFNIKVRDSKISYKIGSKTTRQEILGLYVDDVFISSPNKVIPTYTNTEIIWTDIFDGIDIKMTVTPYTAREYVIFKKNPLLGKPLDGKNLYVKYKLTGRNKNKQPYALDAKGKSVPFYVKADRKGLPVRALYTYTYPITVDPSTSPNPSSDAYTYDGYGRVDNTELVVGDGYYNDGCGSYGWNYYHSYLRFDLASLAGATNISATFSAYKFTQSLSGATDWLRETLGEVDPETGAVATVHNNAAGAVLGTLTAGVGLKSLDVSTYVNTHKGGFCDFGLTGFSDCWQYWNYYYSSESLTNKPYLTITYGAGGSSIKTVNGLVVVSVKTINGLATASVKTWNGLS